MWDTFPHLRRWVNLVASREAVQTGRKVALELRDQKLTEEQEKARRELLFNQTNDSVRAAREAAVQGS